MDIDRILADFERMQSACKEMEGKKILVGIVGGADSEVVKIAHAHEYFDADQGALEQIVTGALDKMMAGDASPDAAAASIGAQSAQLVQNFIDENRVTPPSDYSKKTQKTTLYETGTHIRDRIAFKVVDS